MANYTSLPDGRKVLQFVDPLIKRKVRTIHLGKISKKQADSFQDRLESLITSKRTGRAVDTSVAEWLNNLDERIATKLVTWNLIKPRSNVVSPTVTDFVAGYIAGREDVKPQTTVNHRQAERFLTEFLQERHRADLLLSEFTEHNAEQFRAWLTGKGCSENYSRTHCKNVKMFFRAAVRDRKIEGNPFDGMSTRSLSLPDKLRFVQADDVRQIMEVVPDMEWRVLLTMARWGGLRIPSEIHEFKWDHIHWAANRITIMQPKLQRYQGKDRRIIPLFPEILPILLEASEMAGEGAVYVLPRLRLVTNLRTSFDKFVVRAGVKPWLKPFMNMRSTRETELTERFPIKTVAEWMGHDPTISLSHYQQVLGEHWDRATAESTPNVGRLPTSGAAIRAAESAVTAGHGE